LWAAALALVASTTQAVPLEVYGRLPALEDVAVSPDGSLLAFVRTSGNGRTIVIVSTTEHKALEFIKVGDEKLRGIEWADDSHLLITTSATTVPWGVVGPQREWYGLQVHDVVTHDTFVVPEQRQFKLRDILNAIAARPMIRRVEGHTVLFVSSYIFDGGWSRALFRVDLDKRRQSVVTTDPELNGSWLVDESGHLVAQQDYDEKTQRWAVRLRQEAGFREALSSQEPIDYPEIYGFGVDAGTLLIDSGGEGEHAWKSLSLSTGALGVLPPGLGANETPIYSHVTQRIIGAVNDIRGDPRFIEPNLQARWTAATRQFEGSVVHLVSASSDFGIVAIRVDGPAHGYAYYLADLQSGIVQRFGDVYPGVAQRLEVRTLHYPAKDGLEIPAFLTLPWGRAARLLPLIVLAHGGPASRDGIDFDWWAQALADEGYAVLQANFRGSDLGHKMVEAGYGQWGRKMQSDLSDGVRYLVKEGSVDPSRVCIVGASYGGYAALAGVTLEAGTYRCAVSVAGLSDLNAMLAWVDEQHRSSNNRSQRYWDRFMGASGANDPVLRDISPIRHIDALAVPVLLIHGEHDTVVPIEQSEMFLAASRRAGKDVRLEKLAGEDHWLSRSETRLQMLNSTVEFLHAKNPPD
jgi:dipeptidyl aminopeptidase/acylaminoacyl peptidase